MNAELAELLQIFGKGQCAQPGCGFLRQVGKPKCDRCHRNARINPIVVGSRIPCGAGMPQPSQDVDPASQEVETPATFDTNRPPLRASVTEVPNVPDGWQERIRAIPPTTLIHIQPTLRIRAAHEFELICSGMADGFDEWAAIGEGFFKL